MSVPFHQLPEAAKVAWTRLRDELVAILGDDLIAIWAYGGTIALEGPPRSADLDTYVIVRGPPDGGAAKAIEDIQALIAEEIGIDWDAWYVREEDARRPAPPRHAYREDRLDTSWAINRAHWLAGRYALVHGRQPAEIVPAATWTELLVDLDREVEHLEAHVAAGDTDPYEATYAFLNGSRILRALETRDVAIAKRSAGVWALEHLPVDWHPVLHAAIRAYDGQASAEDAELLARQMAAFVAMVREHLPYTAARTDGPRWSGT